MVFPITSYIVFVYQGEVGTHAPHFPSMDEAEKFANDLRAVSNNLTVSEPIPVTATESYKPKCLQD